MASAGSNVSSPTSPASTTHLERTAHEPRDPSLHRVTISSVQQATDDIRLLRLQPVEGEREIKFLPGQFLDVHVPHLPSAGGFSITSSPSSLRPTDASKPYIEITIQHSPTNPHALYLTETPISKLLRAPLAIRVGGSFTWPPVLSPLGLHRAVFIAGGIGVNPLMSMVRHIADTCQSRCQTQTQNSLPSPEDPIDEKDDLPDDDGPGFSVRILYSVRDPGAARREEGILFLKHLREDILPRLGASGSVEVFLTRGGRGRGGPRTDDAPPTSSSPSGTLSSSTNIPKKPGRRRHHHHRAHLGRMQVHTPILEEEEEGEDPEIPSPSNATSPPPSDSYSNSNSNSYSSSDLSSSDDDAPALIFHHGRIRGEDVERVLGPEEERAGTVVYVCGVPGMTEKLVRRAKKAEGMDERHVLWEKWW